MRIVIVNSNTALVHYPTHTVGLSTDDGTVRDVVKLWLMPLDAPEDTTWETNVTSLDVTAAIEAA